jgi:small subunit ribosomal protein S20
MLCKYLVRAGFHYTYSSPANTLKGRITLPHHKSCKKRLKISAVQRLRNRGIKSAIRNAVGAVETAKTYEDAAANLNAAMSELDKAARKSVIHARRAARKKSRLAAHVARLKG